VYIRTRRSRASEEHDLPNTENTIHDAIRTLLKRRGDESTEVTAESRLADDLDLDSLELAELSAALEDDLGSDPFSEGILPVTVAELVAYYA
jgi:acyl carrier protein